MSQGAFKIARGTASDRSSLHRVECQMTFENTTFS